MSKTSRGGGGVYFFWEGVDHFHLFWGECIWNSTNLGGVSLNFTRMWGGVCCFESRVAKMGGGSTFFIKYGLIIEYICNFFAFLGWFQKNFFSKFSPAQSIWGGCTLSTCILGGVQMGSAENGGGQHPAPEGRKIGTPPPFDVFDTFPNVFLLRTFYFWEASNENHGIFIYQQ